jgi:integrase/recombinase XerD
MLERFTGKPWPLTSGAEMQRFNGHLIEDLHLSAATRSVILSALSSLYNFGMKMREGDGSVACETNPVLAIERPEVQKFGKVGSLDVEQIKALLRDIQHKISRSRGVRQVVHLRNLAMVQFYLYTGKRNVEVSRLRWGQIRRGPRFAGRPEKVEVLWETKGGETRRDVLPEPVWATTWAYLEAAQRTGLREDDYLFIALEDPFDAVQAGKPITDRMVRLMLGRYAKGAGLTHVTVHMLRHSSAMLMKAVGASAMDIQAHLGHSHLNTTQIYLDQLESYENKHWTKVADLLRLASDNVPYRRDGTLPHEKRVLPKGYPPNIRVSKMGKEKA